MREAPAAGSNIGQGRNGGQRIIGRREAEPQHGEQAVLRRIELNGAAHIRRDRELGRQPELVVVAPRHLDRLLVRW